MLMRKTRFDRQAIHWSRSLHRRLSSRQRRQQAHITPRQYVSGESHYYLGKQYQLKVLIQPNEKQGIKLLRGKIEISARQKDSQLVKKLLEEFTLKDLLKMAKLAQIVFEFIILIQFENY